MMAQNGLINFSFWDAAWGIKLCKVLAITINWHQCFLDMLETLSGSYLHDILPNLEDFYNDET